MGKSKYSDEQIQEMIRLYVEDNKTQKEIAEIFCTYNTTIRRILQRNNIEIRGNSEIQSFIKLEDIKDKEGTNSFDYFIGLLASDGCVTNNNIVLDFAENNKEILEQINNWLGNKCNINTSIHKKYKTKQYRLAFRSKQIVEYLSTFGIVSKKSLNLKLSYINWAVLRGIFDGDGCITYMNNHKNLKFQITTGSIDFADQICEFLKVNNITAYIQETKTQEGRNNYYNVCVYKQDDIKLIFKLMYLDASLFLKRKYEKFGSL